MNTITQLQWRYAVKKFDSTKILSEVQITLLKEAFNLTATSYGLQPVKMVVLKNKALQEELTTHSYNQEQIKDASHLLILCLTTNIDRAFIEDYFALVKEQRNTPDTILTPFKDFLIEDFSKKSPETIAAWSTNQAYIALGNLLTVCAIEGIDACPMEGFSQERYNEVLQLDKQGLHAVLAIPVGYRAADDYMKDLVKVRKNTEEMVIEIS